LSIEYDQTDAEDADIGSNDIFWYIVPAIVPGTDTLLMPVHEPTGLGTVPELTAHVIESRTGADWLLADPITSTTVPVP